MLSNLKYFFRALPRIMESNSENKKMELDIFNKNINFWLKMHISISLREPILFYSKGTYSILF